MMKDKLVDSNNKTRKAMNFSQKILAIVCLFLFSCGEEKSSPPPGYNLVYNFDSTKFVYTIDEYPGRIIYKDHIEKTPFNSKKEIVKAMWDHYESYAIKTIELKEDTVSWNFYGNDSLFFEREAFNDSIQRDKNDLVKTLIENIGQQK